MLVLKILYYLLLLVIAALAIFSFDRAFLWLMRSLQVFDVDTFYSHRRFFVSAGALLFFIFAFFVLTRFQTARLICWFLFGCSCLEWLVTLAAWAVRKFRRISPRYVFGEDFVRILPAALGVHVLYFSLVLFRWL